MAPPQSLLVVDDIEAERELLSLTLAAAFPDAEIERAAHPFLAKEMCAAREFNCVIVDYNMPDLDGVTLVGELKSLSPHLPIILMTGVGDEMLAAYALRNGASDYIPKARITSDSIRRSVNRAVHVCDLARLIDEQREELENFAYALAHDFKQPIRQIITFSRMISDEIRSGDVGGIQPHLAFLVDAAGRLAKLVDVMSDYTLLNRPPALADVDLNQVFASVRVSIGHYLSERSAEFIVPHRAPTVRGNETLMTQVVQNLVMNGLQYNRSPVPRVEVKVLGGKDNCTIQIHDNGIGIEAEFLAEIFKPLVRLHSASEYPGSGLGLTLARKAILAQEGAIWCESTLGQGSVFHLRIPVAKPTKKQSKPEDRRSLRAAKPRKAKTS